MIAYVESSAAAKLLVAEPASAALAAQLDMLAGSGSTVVSSVVLETELRRLAMREDLPQVGVTTVLERLDIFQLDKDVYRAAGLLPGRNLRSLDALHVAAALRVGADVMITYDVRQADAARASGLQVAAPGDNPGRIDIATRQGSLPRGVEPALQQPGRSRHHQPGRDRGHRNGNHDDVQRSGQPSRVQP